MKRSRRVSTASPSATIAMSTRTHELRAAGVDVISLVPGEPDLPVPAHAIDATVASLGRGETRYPPLAGIPALRTAAAEMLSRCHGVDFGARDVVVTVGGKLAIYNTLQALVDAGDEVLILAPHWVSYPAQVQLAGGTPVLVPLSADGGFTLDDDALARIEAAVTPRTVGLILNNPNNPTGAVYGADALGWLGDLAERHDFWLLSDDIYSELTYDDAEFTSVLRERPALRDRVILVHGVAKSYAMTGYRVGFLAGPPALVSDALLLQGQETSGATTFAQHGALAALTGDQSFLAG
ncbi:MAG: aspartate aminotransferase, partial [Myxococcota bacterium]